MGEKDVIFKMDEVKKRQMAVALTREGVTWKEVMNELADEWIKKHCESNNPQSQITQFDKEEVMAVPNMYEENPEKWKKFYSLMKEKDYKELDKRVNFLLRLHNQEGKRFSQLTF